MGWLPGSLSPDCSQYADTGRPAARPGLRGQVRLFGWLGRGLLPSTAGERKRPGAPGDRSRWLALAACLAGRFIWARVEQGAAGGEMSGDVITGHDGKPRCAWAGAGDTAFGRYHDEVWGTRTDDQSAMFEALTLGVFEVGLSWSVVFGKREAFREAFRGFSVAKVAAMTERDVDRLTQDA